MYLNQRCVRYEYKINEAFEIRQVNFYQRVRNIAGEMLFPVLFGVLIFVVSFSGPVIGDPSAVIIISSTKVAQSGCGYIDDIAVDVIKTKKSSQLSVNFPVTKELPPEMMISFITYLNGPNAPPLTYNMTICDAWTEPSIGKSIIASGTPKDTFPKECPIVPGPWVVSKWDPPTELVPQGFPPGPVTGSIVFWIEGGETCVTIDFVGELKRVLPGIGR